MALFTFTQLYGLYHINALNKDIEIVNIIIDELDLENTIFTPSQEAQ